MASCKHLNLIHFKRKKKLWCFHSRRKRGKERERSNWNLEHYQSNAKNLFKLGRQKTKFLISNIIIIHELSGKIHVALFIVSPYCWSNFIAPPPPSLPRIHIVFKFSNSHTKQRKRKPPPLLVSLARDMAAEECTATSPTPHSWWDLHPASSFSSWTSSTTNTISWLHHHQKPTNSSSNCDQDDVSISTSFTNASNHSGLTVESSGGGRQLVDQPAVVPPPSNDLIGEHASDNQLWSHVLS